MVYLPPAGGTVTGSKNICQGNGTGTLHANGFMGMISKWQKQHNGEGWTDIFSAFPQYSEIITQPGIWRYRVVVGNGCCDHAFSEPAIISVSQAPSGGTLIGGGVICLGDSIPELTISGYSGRFRGWQKRYNNTSWININDTSQYYSEIPIVPGQWEYRAVVGNDNCEEVFSNSVFFEVIEVPVQFALTEVGSFCLGEAGGALKLEGSQTGIAYQLMKNNSSFGLPKQGNGNPLYWNGVPPGIYSVYAINGQYFCTSMMKGNINIIEKPVPPVLYFDGGGLTVW